MARATAAYDMTFDARGHESNFFRELAEKGQIHIDVRSPPPRPTPFLQRRQDVVPVTISESETETATVSHSETTSTRSSTTEAPESTSEAPDASSTDADSSSLPPTTVSSTSTPSVTVVTTSLPSAFDTSLGSNFTNPSCPKFFSTFLSNTTFQSCIPVSLFLQNSYSFIRVEKSSILLAQTLDAACSAPLAICQPLLTNIAKDLIDSDNCGSDYNRQNPLVMQAYNGLVAYEAVFRATCLKDSGTGNYCFSEAILNTLNPTDFYPYYTAIGMSLPAAVHPTCNQCLKDVMDIYAGYAENALQPLAKTYLPCANQIASECGAGFARTDVQVGSVMGQHNAAIASSSPSLSLLMISALMTAVTLGMGLV